MNRWLNTCKTENRLSCRAQISKSITKIRSKGNASPHFKSCRGRRSACKFPEKRRTTRPPLQSEHILHRIKPGWFADDPLRRAQSAAPENFAAARFVRKLKTFTWSGKNHGVLADHVAFADRLNRNLIIDPSCLAQNFRERFGSATRRIFFGAMMGFDNLAMEFSTKNLCSSVCQSKKRVDTHTEVRCEHDRHRVSSFFNHASLFRGVAGCSNNERLSML